MLQQFFTLCDIMLQLCVSRCWSGEAAGEASLRRRTHGEGIPLPVGNYAARGLGALGGLAGAWQRRHSDTTTTLFVA